MRKTGILIVLAMNAWQDIRSREIHLFLTGILILYGMINIIQDRGSCLEYVASICISALFLGLSIAGTEDIGMGDALLLLALALNLPVAKYLTVLCLTFLGTAAWSMILLVFMKKGRKTEFPFVPFLLLGYVGGLAICL